MYFKKSLILEGTERKKKFKKTLQVIFPLLLGAFILVWVYRDFNFQRVGEVLAHHMNYGWIQPLCPAENDNLSKEDQYLSELTDNV